MIKGALGGLLTGITLSFWVTIGAFVYPAPASKTWPLHLSTEQCDHSNMTTTTPPVTVTRYVNFKVGVKFQRVELLEAGDVFGSVPKKTNLAFL